MIENMFIPDDKRFGSLSKPLSGLVQLVSDGGGESVPIEAVWVGVSINEETQAPKVAVYVSPSSLNTVKAVYEKLGGNIRARPLRFKGEELDAQSFLSMMAVRSSESALLYIQISLVSCIGRLLRTLLLTLLVVQSSRAW